MDLRYDAIGASMAGENRHPQKVLEALGISYKGAIPQSVADQWWFADCENVPDELPSFLSEMVVSDQWRKNIGLGAT